MKNRRTPLVSLDVPDNMTANNLRDLNGKAIRALFSGELPARKASALAQLFNSMYRILPIADLEARLAKLEQQLAEQASPTSAHTDPAGSDGESQLADRTDPQPEDENKLGFEQEAPGESDPSDKRGSS